MNIDPTWIVVAFICAVFVIGFMAGYILGRLEANKLFDLRGKVMQLERGRDKWRNRFNDLNKINMELHEQLNRQIKTPEEVKK